MSERAHGARPAIAVGRFGDGEIAFILPLCVVPERWRAGFAGSARNCATTTRRCWPAIFRSALTPERFLAAWRELQEQMQRDPLLRHDWIEFEKMPQKIGAQINPFTHLAVTPNASGAHLAQLGDDWEKFYVAKRSSATRRRDRAKRRHMSAIRRNPLRHRAGCRRRPAHARNTDGAKKPVAGAQGHRRHLRPAGTPRILSRPRRRTRKPGIWSISAASRSAPTCAAANLGIVFGDCYYHVLASYVRQRGHRITDPARCTCAN